MCDSCSPNWEPPTPGDGEVFYPEDTRQILAPAVTQDELLAMGRALGEAAVPKSYQCTVVDCTDIAVERHLCIGHQRRTA